MPQPARRRWKPGNKVSTVISKTIPPTLLAWCTTVQGKYSVHFKKLMVPELAFYKDELTSVKFTLPPRGKIIIDYEFLDLTELELNNIKTIFMMAYDMALPICQARDRMAEDALQSGSDDAIERNYRPVSQLVVRDRQKLEHDQELWFRSKRAAALARDADDAEVDPMPRTRFHSYEVADEPSEDSGTEDDLQAPDFP